MKVTSPDFASGERLAERHAMDGGNEPPSIAVAGVPTDAVELALIVHDPDAPLPHGFTHWVRYGLPAADGTLTSDDVPHRDGENTFGLTGWSGPQPPAGHGVHHTTSGCTR
jgi:phosphatidylethanolamine-binding protein (PEBP) family uncharacterized protein